MYSLLILEFRGRLTYLRAGTSRGTAVVCGNSGDTLLIPGGSCFVRRCGVCRLRDASGEVTGSARMSPIFPAGIPQRAKRISSIVVNLERDGVRRAVGRAHPTAVALSLGPFQGNSGDGNSGDVLLICGRGRREGQQWCAWHTLRLSAYSLFRFEFVAVRRINMRSATRPFGDDASDSVVP